MFLWFMILITAQWRVLTNAYAAAHVANQQRIEFRSKCNGRHKGSATGGENDDNEETAYLAFVGQHAEDETEEKSGHTVRRVEQRALGQSQTHRSGTSRSQSDGSAESKADTEARKAENKELGPGTDAAV